MTEADFHPDGWHAKNPHVKCCKIPRAVKPEEVDLYQRLLTCHCSHPDKKNPDHECCGKVSITRKAIYLQCSKCGDAKGVLE